MPARLAPCSGTARIRPSSSTSRTTSPTRPAAGGCDRGVDCRRPWIGVGGGDRRGHRRVDPGLASRVTPHFVNDGGSGRPRLAVRARRPTRCSTSGRAAIVLKGATAGDGYSGFTMRDHVIGSTSRPGSRRAARAGVRRVVVVGLAIDYCVQATALDAVRLGFETALLTDAVAAVDLEPGDGDELIEAMGDAGVTLWRTVMRSSAGPSASRSSATLWVGRRSVAPHPGRRGHGPADREPGRDRRADRARLDGRRRHRGPTTLDGGHEIGAAADAAAGRGRDPWRVHGPGVRHDRQRPRHRDRIRAADPIRGRARRRVRPGPAPSPSSRVPTARRPSCAGSRPLRASLPEPRRPGRLPGPRCGVPGGPGAIAPPRRVRRG